MFIFSQASNPTKDWGPYLKKFRGERYANMAEPEEAIAISKQNEKEGENPAYVEDEATNDQTDQTKM